MIKHDRFVLLHIPKTGGTQISNAVLQAVGEFRRVEPLHGVLSDDLPALAFVRHPLAWLASFWHHNKRARTDWAGMPLQGELSAMARGDLSAFLSRAGSAKMTSRIWSAYSVGDVRLFPCERWITALTMFLDDLSVPYSYDWLCLSRGGPGQPRNAVTADMIAALCEADPDAFRLGGY